MAGLYGALGVAESVSNVAEVFVIEIVHPQYLLVLLAQSAKREDVLKIGHQGDALQLSPSFDVLRAHLIILTAGGAATLAFAFARGVGPAVGRPPCSGGRGGLFGGLRRLGH